MRRGIDPGLVEWVKGNNFRTRVYPIPAKGTKRVVLGYDTEVREGKYVLPLGGYGRLDEFSYRARVHGAMSLEDGAHRDESANDTGFSEHGTDSRDFEPVRDLEIWLPGLDAREVAVERARVRSALAKEPELVFVARTNAPKMETTRTIPRAVTVLWDASGSAASRNVEKELKFLEGYVGSLEDGALVRLVAFSNEVWPLGDLAYEVKEKKCPALLEKIRSIRPDGGTRLSCLDLRKWDAKTNAYLLFSDGLSCFGEGEPALGTKPVTCVNSAASADFEMLDRIAEKGRLLDLARVELPLALARAFDEPAVLLGISFDEARVAEVFLGSPARLEGSTLTLAGRVRAGEKTKVTLRFGHGSTETARQEIEIDPARLTETGMAERIWATKKIASLSRRKVENEGEIVKTAKAHGIVTPFTSLLVLETLQDYVRYRVVPPKEMQDEYWKIVESEKTAQAKTTAQRLDEVRAKWKARCEWWKKDFSYPADFRWVDKDSKKDAAGGTLGGGRDMPPPGAPEPPRESSGEETRESHGRGGEELAKKLKAGKGGGGDDEPEGIALKPWDPKTPYLEAFRKCEGQDALYAAYLEQRKAYATSTAFFLDSADYFYEQKQPELALRILSNLAELQLENAPLLRILGYRLKEAGEVRLAISVFKEVIRIRPEEPQSFRDLALAQADAKDWKDAIANLEKVVLGSWDGRFPDIDLIALGELNDVVGRAGGEGRSFVSLPEDLIAQLDCDLRVILTWDADACDMDLWVTEPSGEKAFYGHTQTTIGGGFGRDFTQGYGPEEYLLKKSMKGTYKIQVNYYGNRQQVIAGDTTIQVTVIKNYGRKDEERRSVTRRLKEKRETIDIAEVVFGK
ncbi:DUF2135 domain-containing protein [bacterium]|nr:DUF2135 domain-containing protein [bacterium]